MEEQKKCSFEEHKEIDAIIFCSECRIYMCNKCENHHSSLFKNHHPNKNRGFLSKITNFDIQNESIIIKLWKILIYQD